jgi:hypothetical protein
MLLRITPRFNPEFGHLMPPGGIVERRGLRQVNDPGAIAPSLTR